MGRVDACFLPSGIRSAAPGQGKRLVMSMGAQAASTCGVSRSAYGDRPHSAFTLLELLVVVSVIALLISILVPAMAGARNEATTTKCLANLREMLAATLQYMEGDEQRQVVWYYYPPHFVFENDGIKPYTPWIFGGFKAPSPDSDSKKADSSLYPAQLRPLNAIVAPQVEGSLSRAVRGNDVIDIYKCPSDRSNSTSIIKENVTDVEEENKSSWEVNGSSYTLNTRFAQGYRQANGGDFELDDFVSGAAPDNVPFGKRLSRHLIGDGAARFIMWGEQGFYSATYRATPELPNGAAPRRRGWHRKFSSWSVGFADGHALYGYYDTRLTHGLGGTIWQPNFSP